MDPKFADVSDELWERMRPLLPREKEKPRGGRPRVPDRRVLAGIVFRLKTGCQWKALPREFGSGSTCHLRMQEWQRAGVFQEIFRVLLEVYSRRKGIASTWTSLDSAIVKAPKGGTKRALTRRTEPRKVQNATS